MSASERNMKKKQAILEAATRLFSLKGFKDTSMAELSKMTGVAQGIISKTKKSFLFLSSRHLRSVSSTNLNVMSVRKNLRQAWT